MQVHRLFLCCAVFGLALLSPRLVQAQGTGAPVPNQNFALAVSDYKTLRVEVEDISPNGAQITTAEVQTRTESRIKTAGLQVGENKSCSCFFGVAIYVNGSAYNIKVDFVRLVSWDLPDGKTVSGAAATWSSALLVTAQNDRASVLNNLDKLVDEFAKSYLQANPLNAK
jgi:hypothetical protein